MPVPILHCYTVQTAVEFCDTDNNITLYVSTDSLLLYNTDCSGLFVLLIIITLYMAVSILYCCIVQTAPEFCATDYNNTLYGSTATDNNITLYGSISTDNNITLYVNNATDNNITLYGSTVSDNNITLYGSNVT
jgi:hypothetical protein